MVVQFTVHYKFSQKFPFPARDVYDWSTDYAEDDWRRMAKEGTREIEKLDDATIVLTDTVYENGNPTTKVRLVRLFPEQLMWTNTRVSETGKHSQFIYQIVPDGKNRSRLDFFGAQVEVRGRKPTARQIATLAKENTEADSLTWAHLADALKQELGPQRSRDTSKNRAR